MAKKGKTNLKKRKNNTQKDGEEEKEMEMDFNKKKVKPNEKEKVEKEEKEDEEEEEEIESNLNKQIKKNKPSQQPVRRKKNLTRSAAVQQFDVKINVFVSNKSNTHIIQKTWEKQIQKHQGVGESYITYDKLNEKYGVLEEVNKLNVQSLENHTLPAETFKKKEVQSHSSIINNIFGMQLQNKMVESDDSSNIYHFYTFNEEYFIDSVTLDTLKHYINRNTMINNNTLKRLIDEYPEVKKEEYDKKELNKIFKFIAKILSDTNTFENQEADFKKKMMLIDASEEDVEEKVQLEKIFNEYRINHTMSGSNIIDNQLFASEGNKKKKEINQKTQGDKLSNYVENLFLLGLEHESNKLNDDAGNAVGDLIVDREKLKKLKTIKDQYIQQQNDEKTYFIKDSPQYQQSPNNAAKIKTIQAMKLLLLKTSLNSEIIQKEYSLITGPLLQKNKTLQINWNSGNTQNSGGVDEEENELNDIEKIIKKQAQTTASNAMSRRFTSNFVLIQLIFQIHYIIRLLEVRVGKRIPILNILFSFIPYIDLTDDKTAPVFQYYNQIPVQKGVGIQDNYAIKFIENMSIIFENAMRVKLFVDQLNQDKFAKKQGYGGLVQTKTHTLNDTFGKWGDIFLQHLYEEQQNTRGSVDDYVGTGSKKRSGKEMFAEKIVDQNTLEGNDDDDGQKEEMEEEKQPASEEMDEEKSASEEEIPLDKNDQQRKAQSKKKKEEINRARKKKKGNEKKQINPLFTVNGQPYVDMRKFREFLFNEIVEGQQIKLSGKRVVRTKWVNLMLNAEATNLIPLDEYQGGYGLRTSKYYTHDSGYYPPPLGPDEEPLTADQERNSVDFEVVRDLEKKFKSRQQQRYWNKIQKKKIIDTLTTIVKKVIQEWNLKVSVNTPLILLLDVFSFMFTYAGVSITDKDDLVSYDKEKFNAASKQLSVNVFGQSAKHILQKGDQNDNEQKKKQLERATEIQNDRKKVRQFCQAEILNLEGQIEILQEQYNQNNIEINNQNIYDDDSLFKENKKIQTQIYLLQRKLQQDKQNYSISSKKYFKTTFTYELRDPKIMNFDGVGFTNIIRQIYMEIILNTIESAQYYQEEEQVKEDKYKIPMYGKNLREEPLDYNDDEFYNFFPHQITDPNNIGIEKINFFATTKSVNENTLDETNSFVNIPIGAKCITKKKIQSSTQQSKKKPYVICKGQLSNLQIFEFLNNDSRIVHLFEEFNGIIPCGVLCFYIFLFQKLDNESFQKKSKEELQKEIHLQYIDDWDVLYSPHAPSKKHMDTIEFDITIKYMKALAIIMTSCDLGDFVKQAKIILGQNVGVYILQFNQHYYSNSPYQLVVFGSHVFPTDRQTVQRLTLYISEQIISDMYKGYQMYIAPLYCPDLKISGLPSHYKKTHNKKRICDISHIDKTIKQSVINPSFFKVINLFYDIETFNQYSSSGSGEDVVEKMIPYCVSVYGDIGVLNGVSKGKHQEKNIEQVFWGEKTCVDDFIDYIDVVINEIEQKSSKELDIQLHVWGFNSGRFDTVILLPKLMERYAHNLKITGNTTNIKILHIYDKMCQFRDLRMVLPRGSLKQLCLQYGCEQQKADAPENLTNLKQTPTDPEEVEQIKHYCLTDSIATSHLYYQFREYLYKILVDAIVLQIKEREQKNEKDGGVQEEPPLTDNQYQEIACSIIDKESLVQATLSSTVFKIFKLYFCTHPIQGAQSPQLYQAEKDSYHGGVTSVFDHAEKRNVKYVDVNSLYPSVMIDGEFPLQYKKTKICDFNFKIINGQRCGNNTSAGVLPDSKPLKKNDLYLVNSFKFKKDQQLTIFPVKTRDGSLLYPIFSDEQSWRWGVEINFAEKHQMLESIDISQTIKYCEGEKVFNKYVSCFYELKKKCSQNNNHLGASITKLMLNSVYGKFGQKIFNQDIYLQQEELDIFNLGFMESKCINSIKYIQQQCGDQQNIDDPITDLIQRSKNFDGEKILQQKQEEEKEKGIKPDNSTDRFKEKKQYLVNKYFQQHEQELTCAIASMQKIDQGSDKKELIKVSIKEPDGKLSHIGGMVRIASYVTALARVRLFEAMVIAGSGEFFYCDTDSLFVSQTGYENLLREGQIDNYQLGKFKLEEPVDAIDKAQFISAKMYYYTFKPEVGKKPVMKCKGIPQDVVHFSIFNEILKYGIAEVSLVQWKRHFGNVSIDNDFNKKLVNHTRRKVSSYGDTIPFYDYNDFQDTNLNKTLLCNSFSDPPTFYYCKSDEIINSFSQSQNL